MYLSTLNKGIPKYKARKLKINFKKTKDNIFSYVCVKEERMIGASQQNEVDFSCHSSLLGSVMFVEKSASICCTDGLITGLIFIALFPPSAQSAHCTKLHVCSRIHISFWVALCFQGIGSTSKSKIKYHFYKKAPVPRIKTVKCLYGLCCMICAETGMSVTWFNC